MRAYKPLGAMMGSKMTSLPSSVVTSSWKDLKARVLARDGHKCMKCKRKDHLTPHHIKPRKWGGKDELRNLITFCSSCHDAVELATEAAGEPLSWELLTAPPSHGQDKEKRLWFIDKRGRVSAIII